MFIHFRPFLLLIVLYKTVLYTIVDIETTGGNPQKEKITEIAAFLFDGEKIVDKLVTLINPERPIPEYITKITGINNEMVADAPKFYEIAKQLVEITEGQVFVAHNSAFDFGFIQQEFRSLGFTFQRKTLDTVRLSRKLLPGHKSYSLGNICSDLGIEISARHRAAGDALATVELFKRLLSEAGNDPLFGIQASKDRKLKLNPKLDWETIEDLPTGVGVYYLYDEQDELIYIGKSTNIHSRVIQHLGNIKSEKARNMRDAVVNVSYEITGSELIALLLESDEIKKHTPLYNRAQRRSSFSFGLHTNFNEQGYICFDVKRNNKKSLPIVSFATQKEGKAYLTKQVREFELCQKLSGLYNHTGACFHHSIGQCNGACIGKEAPEAYNARAHKFIAEHKYDENSFLIIDTGRSDDERSVVKVENGQYCGFGFVGVEEANDIEVLKDVVKSKADNREIQQIIRSYLKSKKYQHLIPF